MSVNVNSLYFGFAACGLWEVHPVTGKQMKFIGSSDIVGSVTANLKAPIKKTNGGATSYAIAARIGRSEGELTLNLNERPLWLDAAVNEADFNETPDSLEDLILDVTKKIPVKSPDTVVGKITISKLDDSPHEISGTYVPTLGFCVLTL